MKTLIAAAIAVFVSFLGLNGVGQAQTAAELQGSIDAVDCQSGTFTLDSAGNTETIYASDQTAVAVQESTVPFCTLEGYVGAPVDAWVVPYGSEFIATQIDVTGPVPVLAASQTAIAPMPLLGTVLGTVLVAGLLYLISHNASGGYYRYPYYGAYYHHYYSARYRPYGGYYPASAPLILAAEPLLGAVLGIITVNNYQYLAVRDYDGQYRRYPYYGPYRSYYYHPTYRSYSGTYVNVYVQAPVAVGDPHWDAPRYQMQQIARTVTSRPSPWSAPHRALPAPQAQPTYQRPQQQWQPQAQPTYQRPQPQQVQPTYQRPQQQWQPQAQPTYQRPQPQQAQPTYQRPQQQWQPQAQPTYQRPQPQQVQPTYQRPQPQQFQPTYQRPQAQPTYQRPQQQWQPQAQPTYQRPQPQQAQPTYQRPQQQWQPQAQPTYQRPQPQQAQPTYQRPQPQQAQPTYQRPQPQQAQPTYQRPQPQQPAQPQQQQAQPQRGNSGGAPGYQKQQQCDPRSNQGCNTPEN
ncbi:MAG TPA: hypothetical protein VKT83_11385 [bacterium]|nr:hypothetical protein [bacterium]